MRVLWIFICICVVSLQAQAQDCGPLNTPSNGDIADADQIAGSLNHLSCRIDKVKPDRVISVDQSGGDFTTINAAMAAIGTDLAAATSDNPVLIKLGPGQHYVDETLNVKDHVYIQGSGRDVTELTCDPDKTCGYLVRIYGVEAGLSDMTISSDGYAIRTYHNALNSDCNISIANVHIDIVFTRIPPTGIDAFRCGSIYLRDVEISMEAVGTYIAWGIYAVENGTITTQNVKITGGNAESHNYGFLSEQNGYEDHFDLDIEVTGGGQGGNAYGYHLTGTGGASPPSRVRNSSIRAFGGASNFGVYVSQDTSSVMQFLNTVIYAGQANAGRYAMYCGLPNGSSSQIFVAHSTVNSQIATSSNLSNANCFRCAFVWNYLSGATVAGEELSSSCAMANQF